LRETAGYFVPTKLLPVLTGLEVGWTGEREWKQCGKTFILAIRLEKSVQLYLLYIIDINKERITDWNLENDS